ncbi:MAG: GNAT family N-acetyltransferase [Actinobacteria bacterium]|nr:GNAT family N-acetyltransferase [Actinomycetota bacterium]
MAVSIREGDVDDIAAAVPLLNEVDSTRVATEAGSRHRLLAAPPEARRNWWAARDGESLVGWASAGVDHDTTARSGYLGVWILESHRRRGIGTVLVGRALAHLGDSTRIQASASEAGRGFPERYGFRHTHTRRVSGVDPRAVDTGELDSAEAAIASLLEVGPEQVFVVDAESVLDEPGDDVIDAVEYDQWLRDYWEHPDLDLALSQAAVADGRAVAVAYVSVDRESRRALNSYTGSLRAYRGRGFARLAKLAAMRRLAGADIELVLTENDETNAPMLAINDRLGYRPIESRYAYVLDRRAK